MVGLVGEGRFERVDAGAVVAEYRRSPAGEWLVSIPVPGVEGGLVFGRYVGVDSFVGVGPDTGQVVGEFRRLAGGGWERHGSGSRPGGGAAGGVGTQAPLLESLTTIDVVARLDGRSRTYPVHGRLVDGSEDRFRGVDAASGGELGVYRRTPAGEWLASIRVPGVEGGLVFGRYRDVDSFVAVDPDTGQVVVDPDTGNVVEFWRPAGGGWRPRSRGGGWLQRLGGGAATSARTGRSDGIQSPPTEPRPSAPGISTSGPAGSAGVGGTTTANLAANLPDTMGAESSTLFATDTGITADSTAIYLAAAAVSDDLVEAGLRALLPDRDGDALGEADLRRLAVRVGLDHARLQTRVARLLGMSRLPEGWLERLRGLMRLAIGVLDRVPDTPDELEDVRRLRDLIAREIVRGGVDRVSVEWFDVLVAAVRGEAYSGVATPAGRAKVVAFVADAKRPGHSVTLEAMRSEAGSALDRRVGQLWDARQVLGNGVVWLPDPAVPPGDAGLRRARERAESLPADPDGLRVVVYADPRGGDRLPRVSWNGRELWREELSGFGDRLGQRNDHQSDFSPSYRPDTAHDLRGRRPSTILWYGAKPTEPEVRWRWPQVRLDGEVVVWADGVLVKAPQGHEVRSTEAGLVLFKKGALPGDVARPRTDVARVTAFGVDTKIMLTFVRSMGNVGQRAILDIRPREKMTVAELLRIAGDIGFHGGVVVVPRDGLVTPVPPDRALVGGFGETGERTFPQLGREYTVGDSFRSRYGQEWAVGTAVQGLIFRFWPPFRHTHVLDLSDFQVLWVRSQRQQSPLPDLGPFGMSDEPTVVVGEPGESVPNILAKMTFENLLGSVLKADPSRRFVLHGPVLSGVTEMLGAVVAERVGEGVLFVRPVGLARDVAAAHRAAAGALMAVDGEAVVYVAPGLDDEQRFVLAVDQVLTRLPEGRGGRVRLVVPPDRSAEAWAGWLVGRYSAITVTVAGGHDQTTMPALASAARGVTGGLSRAREQLFDALARELGRLDQADRRELITRRKKDRDGYQDWLRSLGDLIDPGGGSDAFYEVVRRAFGSQLRQRFGGLPGVAQIRESVRSALEVDFGHYLADDSPFRSAGGHPVSDLLRGHDVDVDDVRVRERLLESSGSEGGWDVDLAGHMIDVVAGVFGWAVTVLGPSSARHGGDSGLAPVGYVYYDDVELDNEYRAVGASAGPVAEAAELWPQAGPVEEGLRRRVMDFVADRDRLVGVGYEPARKAAEDRAEFDREVDRLRARLGVALLRVVAAPTHRELWEMVVAYRALAEWVVVPAGWLVAGWLHGSGVLVLGPADWYERLRDDGVLGAVRTDADVYRVVVQPVQGADGVAHGVRVVLGDGVERVVDGVGVAGLLSDLNSLRRPGRTVQFVTDGPPLAQRFLDRVAAALGDGSSVGQVSLRSLQKAPAADGDDGAVAAAEVATPVGLLLEPLATIDVVVGWGAVSRTTTVHGRLVGEGRFERVDAGAVVAEYRRSAAGEWLVSIRVPGVGGGLVFGRYRDVHSFVAVDPDTGEVVVDPDTGNVVEFWRPAGGGWGPRSSGGGWRPRLRGGAAGGAAAAATTSTPTGQSDRIQSPPATEPRPSAADIPASGRNTPAAPEPDSGPPAESSTGQTRESSASGESGESGESAESASPDEVARMSFEEGFAVYALASAETARLTILDPQLFREHVGEDRLLASGDPDLLEPASDSAERPDAQVVIRLRFDRSTTGPVMESSATLEAVDPLTAADDDFATDPTATKIWVSPRLLPDVTVDAVRFARPGQGWLAPDDFVAEFERGIAERARQDVARRRAESTAAGPAVPSLQTHPVRLTRDANVEDLVATRYLSEAADAGPGDLRAIRYREEAEDFERRLSSYLLGRPDVVEQVRTLIAAIWDRASSEQRRRLGAEPDQGFAGAVGVELGALSRVVESGNVRELMAMFFLSSHHNVLYELLETARPTRPAGLEDEQSQREGIDVAGDIARIGVALRAVRTRIDQLREIVDQLRSDDLVELTREDYKLVTDDRGTAYYPVLQAIEDLRLGLHESPRSREVVPQAFEDVADTISAIRAAIPPDGRMTATVRDQLAEQADKLERIATELAAAQGRMEELQQQARQEEPHRVLSRPLPAPDEVHPPLSLMEWRGVQDGSLPWLPTSAWLHVLMSKPVQHSAQDTGGLIETSTSGSAYLLAVAAHRMSEHWGVPVDFGLLRLALVGSFWLAGHHPFHETMRGFQYAVDELGLWVSEYVDNWSRYRYLAPASEEELRTHVARDRLFPDEHAHGTEGVVTPTLAGVPVVLRADRDVAGMDVGGPEPQPGGAGGEGRSGVETSTLPLFGLSLHGRPDVADQVRALVAAVRDHADATRRHRPALVQLNRALNSGDAQVGAAALAAALESNLLREQLGDDLAWPPPSPVELEGAVTNLRTEVQHLLDALGPEVLHAMSSQRLPGLREQLAGNFRRVLEGVKVARTALTPWGRLADSRLKPAVDGISTALTTTFAGLQAGRAGALRRPDVLNDGRDRLSRLVVELEDAWASVRDSIDGSQRRIAPYLMTVAAHRMREAWGVPVDFELLRLALVASFVTDGRHSPDETIGSVQTAADELGITLASVTPADRQLLLELVDEVKVAGVAVRSPALRDGGGGFLRDRVWRYRAAKPGSELSQEDKAFIVRDLLRGSATEADQSAAVTLLSVTDDAELGQLFAVPDFVSVLDVGVPAGSPVRAELETFFEQRFEGGYAALSAGSVAARGQPGVEFDPVRLDTGTVEEALAYATGLPLRQQMRAIGWLAARWEHDTPTDATREDRVLRGLFAAVTGQLDDSAVLREVTLTPPAVHPDAVRRLLSPPQPAAAKSAGSVAPPGEDFASELRAALNKDIPYLEKLFAEGKGEAEHTDPTNLHSWDHIGVIAGLAKRSVDEVFGKLASHSALQPDRPDRRGNIHDLFDDFGEELRSNHDGGRTLALDWLRHWLSSERVQAVLARHHARPEFDDAFEPHDRHAEIIKLVFDAMLGEPGVADRVLRIRRGWEGRADPENHEVWIQRWKQATGPGNQFWLWELLQTLIHEYLHLLMHRRFLEFAKTFGRDSAAYNALVEGVVSLLTKVVWHHASRYTSDPATRAMVEGEYGSLDPLEVYPDPAEKDYKSIHEVMRLVYVVGVENLFAAFFSGLVDRITGPQGRSPTDASRQAKREAGERLGIPDAVDQADEPTNPRTDPPRIDPPRTSASGVPTFPPNTVALFADGSYAVAKQPVGTISNDEQFTGFLIFGPDHTARGVYDARSAEDSDHVAIWSLNNRSDVPGALDLATWYVTGHSDKAYFESKNVAERKPQRVREVEYKMERRTDKTTLRHDYRQLRQTANEIAQRRLKDAGWTLAPDGGHGEPAVIQHPWTSDQSGWAPVAPDGTTLDVITETLEGGSTRQVSGRSVGHTFEIVSPETGRGVYRLHATQDRDGTQVWSGDVLSPSDVIHFYRLAKQANWRSATDVLGRVRHWAERTRGRRTKEDKANEFVAYVVKEGVRLRDDIVRDGYGLYRLEVNGRVILVRARVDDASKIWRARRPTPLDETLEDLRLEDLVATLRGAGWTIRSSHTNTPPYVRKQLGLDAFSENDNAQAQTLRAAARAMALAAAHVARGGLFPDEHAHGAAFAESESDDRERDPAESTSVSESPAARANALAPRTPSSSGNLDRMTSCGACWTTRSYPHPSRRSRS